MNSTASGITDGVIEQELADSAPSVVRRRPHALYLFVLGAEATQADRPDEFAVDTRYPEPEVSRRLMRTSPSTWGSSSIERPRN